MARLDIFTPQHNVIRPSPEHAAPARFTPIIKHMERLDINSAGQVPQ
jgi:hypothetical protein